MANILTKNKGIVVQTYLIVIAASALLCRPVFYYCMSDLQYCEQFILWKPIPWMLTPLLTCALLGAFFTERGSGKIVGIAGIMLMLASTIVQSGSMVWMTTLKSESDVLLVKLNDYPVRLPMSFFLVGLSFMRGGAIALMISLLSRVRHINNSNKESQLFASFAILTSVLAVWLIVARPDLTWPLVGASGFVFSLMLLPAFFYYTRLDEDRCELNAKDEHKEILTKQVKSTILPILILVVSAIIITSFWHYLPMYWWEGHMSRGLAYVFSLSMSSLAIGIGLLVFRKKESKFNRPLIGSILLFFGLPIVPLLLDDTLIDFIPHVAIGIGLAMILGTLMDVFVMVPTKHYAMTWIGIVAVVVIVSKLLIVIFNRLALVCKGMSINMYILFPLIAFSVIIMCYCLKKK